MRTYPLNRTSDRALVALFSFLLVSGCGGDDGTGVEEEQTGATLQGTVTAFQASDPGGVTVAIAQKSTETDAGGSFSLTNIPVGDQTVTFSKAGAGANYALGGITMGETFTLNQIQVAGGLVTTAHTGTWVGTGGSTDPGSAGQIGLTMIIQANGNAITGTASVEGPDGSNWSISGTENGAAMKAILTVVSSNSPCAAAADMEGTFSADTLSGTFVEINPPAGCGSPESGTFRVVKQ